MPPAGQGRRGCGKGKVPAAGGAQAGPAPSGGRSGTAERRGRTGPGHRLAFRRRRRSLPPRPGPAPHGAGADKHRPLPPPAPASPAPLSARFGAPGGDVRGAVAQVAAGRGGRAGPGAGAGGARPGERGAGEDGRAGAGGAGLQSGRASPRVVSPCFSLSGPRLKLYVGMFAGPPTGQRCPGAVCWSGRAPGPPCPALACG